MLKSKILEPTINSSQILDEIRELSVAWGEHYSDGIWNRFKLASDIQYVTTDLLIQFAKFAKIPNPENAVTLFKSGKLAEMLKQEDLQSGKAMTPKLFTVSIDQIDYEWPSRFITGSQIKALQNVPSSYGVWVQLSDKKDKELGDNEEVDLKEPKSHSFITGSKYSTEG